jgi:hypothetical protein
MGSTDLITGQQLGFASDLSWHQPNRWALAPSRCCAAEPVLCLHAGRGAGAEFCLAAFRRPVRAALGHDPPRIPHAVLAVSDGAHAGCHHRFGACFLAAALHLGAATESGARLLDLCGVRPLDNYGHHT